MKWWLHIQTLLVLSLKIIGVQPGIHNDKRRMDSWTPMMWERAPISLTLIGFLLSLELPVLLRFTRLRLYEWILEVPGSLEDLVKMNCCLQASDSYHRSVEHMILMTDLWFITWELIHNHLKVPRLWMKNSHVVGWPLIIRPGMTQRVQIVCRTIWFLVL